MSRPVITAQMRRRVARPRGAAALAVVLVLFFVISMVAAYTSRSMIFEQRTSANQLRSTQAHDIAEAGIEWALAKLNTGRIDPTCGPDPAGANSFRERYLAFNATTGLVTAAAAQATCVLTGGAWSCSCPDAGASIPAVAGDGPFPAFRVFFVLEPGGARPYMIRMQVSACTNADANCLANPQVPTAGQGNAIGSVIVALRSAINTTPGAALTLPAPTTADPSLTLAGGTLLVAANGSPSGSGVAVQAGGTLPASGLTVTGAPGSPAANAKVESDLTLAANATGGGIRQSADAASCPAGSATHPGCPVNRMFTGLFGVHRPTFLEQPALVTCSAGCNASALETLRQKNPRSVIVVEGAADLDGNLGSASDPVALVVRGDVTLSGGAVVTGLVYSTSGTWTASGVPSVVGAMVGEVATTIDGGGTLSVRYDPDVLFRLRSQFGSFVRLPGSWRDWQP